MWGIIPAAGMGTRIQPLAFSKELLPVGSRLDNGIERPKAVSEYLIDRMRRAGATKLCFVISPWKSDIIQYFGARIGDATTCYTVQSPPAGLCDALFQALPLISPNEQILVGLPDTVWFPEDALQHLPDHQLSFLLFPVPNPHLFDAVLLNEHNQVLQIQVKHPNPTTNWIWGAFKLTGRILHHLHTLWQQRHQQDEYLGTLINAWLQQPGNSALGVRAGQHYVDVGTLHGYREAQQLLQQLQQSQKGSHSYERQTPESRPNPAPRR